MLKKLFKNTKGQGMTEYVIILALVAIVAIVVVTQFGDKIKDVFTTSTERLESDVVKKIETKKK